MAAQEINFTMMRYNGSEWDTLYPATVAGQVIQSSTRVFLHPTTNKVNNKAFGTISGDTWTPQAITLYGTDIAVSSSDATTLASAVTNVVKSTNAFTTDSKITFTDGTSGRNIKQSSYGIMALESASAWSSATATERQYNVPTISSLMYFPGSNQITTLGTITTGVWNGTTIAVANGGTGATTASGARTNLGLGSVATYDATNNASDIESASSTTTKVPTAYAVQQYVAGIRITYSVVWATADYTSATAPTAAKLATIPYGTEVKYNNGASTATGTLAAGASQVNKILLVYSPNNGQDTYDEYLCVLENSTYVWEKLGHTDVDLSGYVKKGTLSSNCIAIASGTDTINANTYSITTDGTTVPVEYQDTVIPTESKIRNSILYPFTGTTNITMLGTITTGVWHGTAIDAAYIGNLASSKITAMTGYSKASDSAAISTSDSLNTAVGKLEYKADVSLARAQIFWADATSDVSGMKEGDFAFIY